MKYKLICSDLDDTLLNNDGDFSDNIKNSIKRYVDSGGKFMIVTGRMTAATLPLARRMELHGEIVTFQGGVTCDVDTGAVIERITIDTNEAVIVAKYLESKGYYFHTYVDDYFITQKECYFSKYYAKVCISRCVETVMPLSEYMEKNKVETPKILICANEEDVPRIMKEMQIKFGDKFLINTSKPWLIEFVPNTVSKATGIDHVAKKYNIKKEEIICIGDSFNDAEMLKYAGLACVVENGSPAAKKYADIIVPSNSEEGVAFVINKYGFLK
jgi:Cof subfamily protein (haloacid dehalogenase superfamily)